MAGSFGARAAYAADPRASRGRLRFESPSPTRTPFQRDRDRIVHSTAFRRLAHKTQVFVHHEGDHFRSRLTHTIEVAQIARALAKSLALDEDLSEAVALGHDLGHTPFGHTGEDALNERMARYGGFEHNAQTLRIVTELERRYAEFDGLNLTFETVEGLVKHNGPLTDESGAPLHQRGVSEPIADLDKRMSLELWRFSSLESQAAAIADDIAYNAHDVDDGLRAQLFDIKAIREVPFLGALAQEIDQLYPGLERARLVHELGRRLVTRFIEDAIVESRRRIAEAGVGSMEDVRAAGRALVGFSPGFANAQADIKSFLSTRMYRHPDVMRVREKADEIVRRLFDAFLADPSGMPTEWALAATRAETAGGEASRARVVADYIAGMTDRYALSEHRRIFDDAPDLR